MPVLYAGDSNIIVLPTTYSTETIERRFEVVESVQLKDCKADLLWDSGRLISCIVSQEIEGGRRKVFASLELQKTKWFEEDALAVEKYWQDELVQVQGVVVLDNLQEFGLATFMYETLILKKGLVLVSDNEQYAGGKALWKHIAKTSTDLKVFVFDSVPMKFYPFDTDERLRYLGDNIPDDEIWSIDPDLEKHPIVLIAESV